MFDARTFDLQAPSTSQAFIKVVDAQTFTLNELVTVDTSTLAPGWTSFSAEVTIDPGDVGDFLQFEFSNVATNFAPSGVLYDNVRFEERISAPGPTVPNAPQGPSNADEWELPALPPSALPPSAPSLPSLDRTDDEASHAARSSARSSSNRACMAECRAR